jgi:hypothetical protein
MSHAVFGEKLPGEKASVNWYTVMIQQSVLLLPKFGAKPLHIFMQWP